MKVDENTKLSLGLVLTLLGGAGWLTTVHLQSVSTASEVSDIKRDMRELSEMRTDLAVVKSDVKRILKKMGE